MLFADHVNDAVERMTGLLALPRLPGDRSQFVRFARAAARVAEWQRAGDTVTGPADYLRVGDGILALVEVSDVLCDDTTAKPEPLVRLIEATNAQLVAQTCTVCGDATWTADPATLAGREVKAVGDCAPFAAVKANAGDRQNHARSQLLAYLVPETCEPAPLGTVAPHVVGWSLKEFSA